MEKIWAVIIIVIAVIVSAIGYVAHDYYETQETEITVKSMYIDHSGDESFYMLSTTDGRVFECDNSIWKGQYSIDKEWAYVEENSTYTVKYFGWDTQNIINDWYYVIYDFVEIDINNI